MEQNCCVERKSIGNNYSWKVNESLGLLGLFYGSNLIISLLVRSLWQADDPRLDHLVPYLSLAAYFLAALLLGLVFSLRYLKMREFDLKQSLYLSFPGLKGIVSALLLAGFLVVGHVFLIWFFQPDISPSPLLNLLEDGWIPLFLFIAIALIIGPFTEEVLFRACLYDAFKSQLGLIPAGLLVSLLFAALHLPQHPLVFGVLFLYSLVFVWLREQSGSLIPSVVAHLAVNSSAILMRILIKIAL